MMLIIFGIIMIYSSSNIWAKYKFDDSFKYVKQQILFFIMGLILIKVISKFDYKKYYSLANKILIVCFILLILVLIPGLGVVRNGSRSWFSLFGFSFQPSEASKLGLIIFSAKYLSKQSKINLKSVFPLLIILLFLLFPC